MHKIYTFYVRKQHATAAKVQGSIDHEQSGTVQNSAHASECYYVSYWGYLSLGFDKNICKLRNDYKLNEEFITHYIQILRNLFAL